MAAADAVWQGQHVVLSTGTASGKSLAYQLPALSRVLARRGARDQRGAGVLYLSPTKALAHDQLSGLLALGLGSGRPRTTVTAPESSATGPVTTRSTS